MTVQVTPLLKQISVFRLKQGLLAKNHCVSQMRDIQPVYQEHENVALDSRNTVNLF